MKQILESRNDVAFYVKMFPLVQIHPEAFDKSKAIVCEKQKNGNEAALKMLEKAFERGKLPAPGCETDAVDKSMALAQSFGLRGTPAMVFQDGIIIKGAVGAPQINQKLDSLK